MESLSVGETIEKCAKDPHAVRETMMLTASFAEIARLNPLDMMLLGALIQNCAVSEILERFELEHKFSDIYEEQMQEAAEIFSEITVTDRMIAAVCVSAGVVFQGLKEIPK